ncbi:glycosyltransferase [Candidatus Kaiserbacteria bacterium]|nr:glycosyltransferase [Candidatus Kaiserbacteria bacterium]
MRILITTGIFEPESGGPATYAPRLAALFVEKGIEVTVATYSDMADTQKDGSYPFKLVRVVRGNKFFNRIRFFFACYAHMRWCDVVYTLDWFAAGLPVTLAAWVVGKPYIVRIGGDYAWEQKYLESGAPPLSLKDFYVRRIHRQGIYAIYFFVIRAILRSAVHIVFNSESQRALYAHYYNLRFDATSVIANPISRDNLASITRGIPTKEIVYWGRLIEMKNVSSLIRAFAQAALPFEYTLSIIGDGPQKELLQTLINELQIANRVNMLPAMPRAAALERVKDARAFVLPSWTDISPNQVYEAIAIGLPSIITQENYLPIRDQFPEMIDPHSVDDIAQKLSMLADDVRYADFAARFHAIHIDRDWDVVVREYTELFKIMIGMPDDESLTDVVTESVDVRPRQEIRVLQISADRSKRGILYPDSPAVERQKAYGEYFEALDIIGFSLVGDKRMPFKASPKVCIYPTRSTSKLFYGIDTIRIARRLQRPNVISVQDPFETGLLGMCMAIAMRVPLHVQVHTDFLAPAYARHSLLNKVRVFIAWIVVRYATRIRVVSNRLKEGLERDWGIRVPVTVLPIFVDIGRIQHAVPDPMFTGRLGWGKYKVLVVARLEPEKNVALAMHAFTQAAPKDAYLIIVGDGSEHGRLVMLAHTLGIADRVAFEGEKDSTPYYAFADLVLVPSLYEGYGVVIVEALASGKTVISTDVGCAREMGATVVKPQDFAQAIRQWFVVPEDRPRGNHLDKYPYQSFEEYVKRYAEDIAASTS